MVTDRRAFVPVRGLVLSIRSCEGLGLRTSCAHARWRRWNRAASDSCARRDRAEPEDFSPKIDVTAEGRVVGLF